jgi:hypothetical protein
MACGPAARQLPWEFLIAEATRRYRAVRTPLIVRRLIRSPASPKPSTRAVSKAAFVRSASATLATEFSFDSELKLLRSSLAEGEGVSVEDAILDPTIAELRAAIAAAQPALLHFAGIDGLQGAALLRWTADRAQPGMFFRAVDSLDPEIVPPRILAAAACAAGTAPALVTYNIYNSSDIAALTVNAGARAAIGFQDEIDDALAELFFASFYRAWQESEWDVLEAYRQTWSSLAPESRKLRGTGIVLWSGEALVEVERPPTPKKSSTTTVAWIKPDQFPDVRDAIEVVVKESAKLNYSMLHNNRAPFEKFEIKRLVRGTLSDICVEIVLHAGNESSRYSAALTLNDKKPIVDVLETARVSLTSELARSLRESVYTSIYVSVMWRDRVVHQQTFRVALLPTDEWRDDDLNRIWLPSFVLPRDPAVPKVVDTAQRYLMALTDDAGSGFDGYQGVRRTGPEAERCRSVDLQVAALWWALVYDYALAYINPPPSFTRASQRLRTPSDVMAGRRGTCIDLTLLLAAVLEYVDIYPVVFLLIGHAFPAYCRSEDAYQELAKLYARYQGTEPGQLSALPAERARQRSWILDGRYYGEIVKLVQNGSLVPLESVALTQRAGFWDAVAQGAENLRSRRDFQYLVDIKRAREVDVTPIPVWSAHA